MLAVREKEIAKKQQQKKTEDKIFFSHTFEKKTREGRRQVRKAEMKYFEKRWYKHTRIYGIRWAAIPSIVFYIKWHVFVRLSPSITIRHQPQNNFGIVTKHFECNCISAVCLVRTHSHLLFFTIRRAACVISFSTHIRVCRVRRRKTSSNTIAERARAQVQRYSTSFSLFCKTKKAKTATDTDGDVFFMRLVTIP